MKRGADSTEIWGGGAGRPPTANFFFSSVHSKGYFFLPARGPTAGSLTGTREGRGGGQLRGPGGRAGRSASKFFQNPRKTLGGARRKLGGGRGGSPDGWLAVRAGPPRRWRNVLALLRGEAGKKRKNPLGRRRLPIAAGSGTPCNGGANGLRVWKLALPSPFWDGLENGKGPPPAMGGGFTGVYEITSGGGRRHGSQPPGVDF